MERRDKTAAGSKPLTKTLVIAITKLSIAVVLVIAAVMGVAGVQAFGYSGIGQLDGTRIGVQTGTADGEIVEAQFPDATVTYYGSATDLATALLKNKIDTFPMSVEVLGTIMHENDQITYLSEPLYTYDCAFAFGKSESGKALCAEFNSFLRRLEADGTLRQMREKWMNGLDHEPVNYDALPDRNGTLRMATDAAYAPFEYVSNGRYAGFDVELAARFCEACGYALEIVDMNFDAVIAAVQTGKCDFGGSAIEITEERAQNVLFSEPYHNVRTVMAVRKAEAPAATDVFLPEIRDFSDLSGKTVSMITGAPFAELIRDKVADVGEFTYFNNTPDMLLALKSGKTDAALANCAVAELAVSRNPELALLPETLMDCVFGFAFAKGDPARDDWQTACDAIPAETKQALWEKWTGPDDSKKTIPAQDWPGKNGTVQVAACDTLEPTCYVGEGGALMGFDIEMILKMAEIMDVHVEFTGMEFSSVLASVQAGKALFGAGAVLVTDERKESMDFVEYYPAAFVLIVRGTQADHRLADLEHARIAVQTGSVNGPLAEARFPDAQVDYYNSQTDVLTALKTGKADAWVADSSVIRYLIIEHPELTILDESLLDSNLAAVFAKTESGQALCDQYSAFIDKLWADGTMAEIDDAWFGTDETKRTVPDYENLPATNGTLHMAADISQPPFTYMKDNRVVGYDVDVAARFCLEYGYGLEIVSMSFDAMLASVQSGKCDFAASCITVTEERAESVLFSTPNYHGGIVPVVWNDGGSSAAAAFGETGDASIIERVLSSFEKTFLREERWKLFVDGVLTTLLITVLSILFGTVLGFLVFMLCRNGNAAANGVTRFSVWLVQGMPMVVLLMVLYYIIFGSVAVSGLLVAVIGFTLTFGASVVGLLKMGVGTIDRGQYEAAYALGYPNRRTFFEVILPQAVPHILPAYKGEIVGLIKATAIVGYIAVQDLTKMGDIVRSRTYEAFFPLIAVTVIYFVLEGLIGLAVSRISVNIDPKRRSREKILKGVKTDD